VHPDHQSIFTNHKPQTYNNQQADLREHPPVLDWDTTHGPKTMLYDLCEDPMETRNLATTEHGRRVAEGLYREVLEVIKDAVRKKRAVNGLCVCVCL
jgi:hypothetical protein